MLEHIADFTAWPILTGIFIGYIANRIMSGEGKCRNIHQPSTEHRTTWQRLSHQLRILCCWCCNIFVDLEETV